MNLRTAVGTLMALGLGNWSMFAAAPRLTSKKGFGLPERKGRLGAAQLEALNVGWYYNWGAESELKTQVPFVPMIFSLKGLKHKLSGDYVLGFNEPDNSKQSDLAVKDALANWSIVAAKGKQVGGPAMAGNPVTGEWLPAFMKARPKVDFATVHWYKGVDAKHFIKDLEHIHATYNKPIWVTEFAPQTAGSSEKDPNKFTQAEVDRFITEVVRWMDATQWVQRYAWHDSIEGTSALFDAKGEMTATGRTYAAVGQRMK
jgi:hypothetical protein